MISTMDFFSKRGVFVLDYELILVTQFPRSQCGSVWGEEVVGVRKWLGGEEVVGVKKRSVVF